MYISFILALDLDLFLKVGFLQSTTLKMMEEILGRKHKVGVLIVQVVQVTQVVVQLGLRIDDRLHSTDWIHHIRIRIPTIITFAEFVALRSGSEAFTILFLAATLPTITSLLNLLRTS